MPTTSSLPSANTFEFLPELFKNQIEDCVNTINSSTTNCALAIKNKTNVASTTNSTLLGNFAKHKSSTKNYTDEEDNKVKDDVDINLHDVSKGQYNNDGGGDGDGDGVSGCSKYSENQNAVTNVKFSFENFNTNIENVTDDCDDEHNDGLTMQTNEPRGSKFNFPPSTKTSNTFKATTLTATATTNIKEQTMSSLIENDEDELLTNNIKQQKFQNSCVVGPGTLKVRDEFLELKNQSNANICPIDCAAFDIQIRGDPQHHHHLHSLQTKELNKKVEQDEEEEEVENVANKSSKCRSRSSSNSSNTSTNSNNSNVHNVGGGVVKKKKFSSDNKKHLKSGQEIENKIFTTCKGKFYYFFILLIC